MKRYVIALAVICAAVFTAPPAPATTIPPEVKEIVTFIFVGDGQGNLVPKGTGFFVGVRNEKISEMVHVYLVTSKHVLQDTQGAYYPSVYIRLNTMDGTSRVEEIPLNMTGPGKYVYTHTDPAVDVAVISIKPSEELYDYKVLPEHYILTRDMIRKYDIREGDDIFFTGLFWQYFGQKRNYPIVRFGKVSMIPEEKISWKDVMQELYLVETQSFGGNSGAPVFFQFSPTRTPGKIIAYPTQVLLAGVMKGNFIDVREMDISMLEENAVSFENVGIAGVVPAYKLQEILFSHELETAREKNIR